MDGEKMQAFVNICIKIGAMGERGGKWQMTSGNWEGIDGRIGCVNMQKVFWSDHHNQGVLGPKF